MKDKVKFVSGFVEFVGNDLFENENDWNMIYDIAEFHGRSGNGEGVVEIPRGTSEFKEWVGSIADCGGSQQLIGYLKYARDLTAGYVVFRKEK